MTSKTLIAGAIVLMLLTACNYRSWTLWSAGPPDGGCPAPSQCPEHVEGAEPSLPLSPLPPRDQVCIEDPAEALLIRDAAFPGDGRIMLATADGAIWTSQDDGRTWTSFGKIELPANSQSCAVWSLMPGGSDSFWVNYDSALAEAGGASMLCIGVSRDGGRTFTPIVFERPLLTALVEQPECDPVIVDVYGQIWIHPGTSADDASSFETSGVPCPLGNAGRACSCDDGSIVILGRQEVSLTRDLGATWEPLPQLDDIRPYRINCGSGYLWLIDSVDDVYRYDLDKETLTLVDYA